MTDMYTTRLDLSILLERRLMLREALDRETMKPLNRNHQIPFLSRRRCSHVQVLIMQQVMAEPYDYFMFCTATNQNSHTVK